MRLPHAAAGGASHWSVPGNPSRGPSASSVFRPLRPGPFASFVFRPAAWSRWWARCPSYEDSTASLKSGVSLGWVPSFFFSFLFGIRHVFGARDLEGKWGCWGLDRGRARSVTEGAIAKGRVSKWGPGLG